MSETPKRRFFQIHLSTAIVLMFVAGGLLWLNLRGRVDILVQSSVVVVFGWPCDAYYDHYQLNMHESPSLKSIKSEWHWEEGALNTGTMITIVLFAALVLEWFTRRREARKQPGRCLPPPSGGGPRSLD